MTGYVILANDNRKFLIIETENNQLLKFPLILDKSSKLSMVKIDYDRIYYNAVLHYVELIDSNFSYKQVLFEISDELASDVVKQLSELKLS